MMRNRALIAAVAALCLPSCTTELADPVEEHDATVDLEDSFAEAARTFDVPVDLLKAISYVETRWQNVDGTDELGRPAAAGVMGLWGDNLARGAAAAGIGEDDARTETDANIA